MNRYSLNKLPSDYLTEIAEKHKLLRKSKGISQTEMARRSGVSLGSLKRFEQSGQISFESLLKLSQILNRLSDFERIFHHKPIEDIEKLFSDKTRS